MYKSFKSLAFATLSMTVATGALAAGDHGHAGEIGKPGKASAASRTVEITLSDNYYEPESVSVKAGETVRFVLHNSGQLLHEFNIGTPHMHEEHQEEMAMMMEHGMLTPTAIDHEKMKMDHGGGHTMKHDDPNSILLEPGKSGEIVWTFPADAELEFACNIPGHYQAGMVGQISIGH